MRQMLTSSKELQKTYKERNQYFQHSSECKPLFFFFQAQIGSFLLVSARNTDVISTQR